MTAIRPANGYAALCAAFLIALSSAAATAAPAYVKSTVNLRAAAGTDNEIVGKIPAGSLIDAENCDNGWCAVNWQGKSGFAIQTAIDTSGRVPAARRAARSYAPAGSGDYIDVGPPVYYGGPIYYGYRPYYGYRRFGYYGYRGYGYRGGWRRRW